MSNVGLVLPSRLYGFDVDETITVAQIADESGFHSLWRGEASAYNTFTLLGVIARETHSVQLGTGIANVFSRSPALLGISAVTLDALSKGRTILGLGVSSPPLVERWHGMEYDEPLRRLRETIEILHDLFEDGAVDYDGSIFNVGPYSAGFDLKRDAVPIFTAALGPTSRKLTGEYADGWLPMFVPKSSLTGQVVQMRETARAAGRDEDAVAVAPMIPTAVANNEQCNDAEDRVRRHLAKEMAMGYNSVVDRYGFGNPADIALELWRDGDREGAAAAISQEMLAEFTIHGTPDECRDQLEAYRADGVTHPIIWPTLEDDLDDVERTIETFSQDGSG